MTPDIFAEWLRSQGHGIVRTANSYWHTQGLRVYQAFPYHWLVRPAEDELTQLLRDRNAIGLRYSTALDAPLGCASYHVVYEKATYDFGDLGKWARKNVRHGLRNCSAERISFQRLAAEGWKLQQDTLARQRRRSSMSRQGWERCCAAAAELPGFEAWGVVKDRCLAASVITFQMDDCCYLLYQQSLRSYLTAHVNNVLAFMVTQTMVGRPEIGSMFYCIHSLDAPDSMDEFKLRMGYTAKPVRQRVVLHPSLSLLFNPVSHALLRSLKAARPGSSILSKVEGMTRFYLEGRRAIHQQTLSESSRDLAAVLSRPTGLPTGFTPPSQP